MLRSKTTRAKNYVSSAAGRSVAAALLTVLLLPAAHGQHGHGGGMHMGGPASTHQMGEPQQRPAGGHVGGNWRPPALRGPHLGNWLQSHQGEPLTQQQNALRQEPGFSRLPQPQQQRLLNRLQQLDTMPPDRRARTLGRIENMEKLSPQRREQVRASAQQLSTMDPARKQQMRAAFRVLRDMPPSERDRVLNSPAYRSMYSDHERHVLGDLLSVEPYQPR